MVRYFGRRARRILAAFLGEDATGYHVDHIKPVAAGGATSLDNAQLIPAKVNLMKGAKYMELRQWQLEAKQAWERRKPDSPFMLVAVPAGGKTFASLKLAQAWMLGGADRRIIVVVPTANLQEQWRDEAADLGVQLQTKEFGSASTFKHGFQGGAVTYSFVGLNSFVLRRICYSAPTMVIFDEVHHCGDEATWGDAVREAFLPSKEKLLLSGTPFRTDKTRIPFVNYDSDGFCIADFTFDYKRALREGVIRYLAFEYSKGSYNGWRDGKEVSYDVHSEIAKDEGSQRLRHLLNPSGQYVADVIQEAHKRLMQVRETTPDAAALAACIDQGHAVEIADVIYKTTGCRPALIVSDGDKANSTVNEFRNSSREWVVAVRQVAEGTDIKRLQVLCYFTNCVTDLFFRQLVGRIQRRRNDDDIEGYVFLPSDPRLIECAENIEKLQMQAIEEDDEEDTGGPVGPRTDSPQFLFGGSRNHGVELVMIAGSKYTLEQCAVIKRIAEVGRTSLETAAAIYHVANTSPQPCEAVPIMAEGSQIPLEVELNQLRKQQQKLAFRYHKKSGIPIRDVHMNFPPVAMATRDQLLEKCTTLSKWLDTLRG